MNTIDRKSVVRVLARGTLYEGLRDAIAHAIHVGAYGGAPLSLGDIKNEVLSFVVEFEKQWEQGQWVSASTYDENFLLTLIEIDKKDPTPFDSDGNSKQEQERRPQAQITPEEIERMLR